MHYDPDQDWSAASWLGAYTDLIYNEFLEYWELQNVSKDSPLTDKHRAHFRSLKELGDALRASLHSLSVGSAVRDKVEQYLRTLGFQGEVSASVSADVSRALRSDPIVRDSVRLALAFQATDHLLAIAERRMLDLIDLVAHREVSPRAAAYLDRASRLFLWGFDAETVVVCGALLEAAYEERFTPAQMSAIGMAPARHEFQAYEYEQAALLLGVYNGQQKRLAASIRRARNDNIHNVPSTNTDGAAALRGTIELLDRLFPPSGAATT